MTNPGRIKMLSSDLRTRQRRATEHLLRGGEVVLFHYNFNNPIGLMTPYPQEAPRLALAIGARAILQWCQNSMQHMRQLETDSPDRPTRKASDRVEVLLARHTAGAQVYHEIKPWIVLAEELGEDGTEPLPDTISTEQAEYVERVAAEHLASAYFRMSERANTWPKPTDGRWQLHRTSHLVEEQAADLRFVAILTDTLTDD